MTWNDLGQLKLRATDPEGRLFPCACHAVPSAWVLMAPPLPDGRVVYVTIVIEDRPKALWPFVFENALNSLVDAFEGLSA